MPDYGRAVISKVIDTSDIITAMSAGTRPNWFEDEDHKRVYTWMLDYFNRYSETPTRRALKSEFPTYKLLRVEEPYEYYMDRFREQRERAIYVDGLIEADEAIKTGDLKGARDRLARALQDAAREVTTLADENAVTTIKQRLQRYKDSRGKLGQLTGIPTGFPTLDFMTGGYQPEQFIIYGGQAKQGKSFTLMRSAVAAHDAGFCVLFLSIEMSTTEQLARYDGITCGLSAAKLIHGAVTDEELVLLRKGFRERKGLKPFVISTDITASTTMSGVAAKIEQHDPDIVFLDGIYLMDNEIGADPGSPRAYTSISRSAKRLSQRTKLPMIATTQALTGKMNKFGHVTMHSLGWSSAWAQDADLILGVEKRVEKSNYITLRAVAGRHIAQREIELECDWNKSRIEEVDIDDDYDEGDDDDDGD